MKFLKSKRIVFFICIFVLFLECKDGFVRFWKTEAGQQIMSMKIDEEVENIMQEQDKVIKILLWEDWIFLWQFVSNKGQNFSIKLAENIFAGSV